MAIVIKMFVLLVEESFLSFGRYVSSQEDKMRDKPGFEHLNEPLHVLVEAELPANIIDTQLIHAREILQELLKPVVS
jgi:hypothetical protein